MKMNALVLILLGVAGFFLAGTQDAKAQFSYGQPWMQNPIGRPPYNPYSRPTFSPYLNLLRGGNQAINYYGLVRPQIQAASAFQQLGMQVGMLQQQIYQPQFDPMALEPPSGHLVVFLNTSHYFQNITGRAPGRTPASNMYTRPPNTGRGTGTGVLPIR